LAPVQVRAIAGKSLTAAWPPTPDHSIGACSGSPAYTGVSMAIAQALEDYRRSGAALAAGADRRLPAGFNSRTTA
jgi:hypothetical protein